MGRTVALERERRVTLCRCGQSNNKPYCDNTHKEISFKAVESDPVPETTEQPENAKLTITVHENRFLELEGAVEILNEAGETLFAGNKLRLCRCGGSNNKPFCDGTHERIAFVAE
jgi:CDGSH-type Zn-finger protein